jgi:MFS family permease
MSTGPASGGLVAQWLGYSAVFAWSGGLLLLVLGGTFLFLPRARHVALQRPPRLPFREVAGELLMNPGLLACWLVTLGACMGTGTFITFVPLHASELGISVGHIGLIFGAQALFNALSRIPFGYLGDKISDRSHLVVGGLLGFALCMAGVGMATNISFFLATAAGLGFCMGIGFTAIGALMSELVSPSCRGLAMGGYNSAIYLGMMLGSLVIGAIVREIGFKKGFLIIGLVNVLVTGGFHFIFKRLPTRMPRC